MNQYVTRISGVNSAKNKLELAIQELIKANDRVIIEGKDLESFKSGIKQQINFLNEEFPRCAPKKPGWCNVGGITKNKDFALSGIECVYFYLHEIKNKYEAQI